MGNDTQDAEKCVSDGINILTSRRKLMLSMARRHFLRHYHVGHIATTEPQGRLTTLLTAENASEINLIQ